MRRPQQIPDHERIARLEHELGIGQTDPEPERGIKPDRLICLIKNCDGDTIKLRTWQGNLIRRIHQH